MRTVQESLRALQYRFTVTLTEDSPEVDRILAIMDPTTKDELRRLIGAPPGADGDSPGFTATGKRDQTHGARFDDPPRLPFDPERLLDGAGTAQRVGSSGSGAQRLVEYRVTLNPRDIDETMVTSTLRYFSRHDPQMSIRTASAEVWLDSTGKPLHVLLSVHANGGLSENVTLDMRCSEFAT